MKKLKLDKIRYIFVIVLAFLYSLSISFGEIVAGQVVSLSAFPIRKFLLSFICALIFNYVLFWVNKNIDFSKFKPAPLRKIESLSDKKFLLITWIFTALLWLPVFLSIYPGVLSYDIVNQLRDATGTITSDHHPVLHTFLIRAFLKLGNLLGGDNAFGIGLMSIFQIVMLSYALARLATLLKNKKVPILFVILLVIFNAVWFGNSIMAATMVKDTLNAAFFVLFCCHFTELVLDPYEYISKNKNLITLPIVILLMCMTRNNSKMTYLFCMAFLVAFNIFRIKRIKELFTSKRFLLLLVGLALPMILFSIYKGPVMKALNIEKCESAEFLCIPIQQLQRVSVRKGDELSAEEKEMMDYYFKGTEGLESGLSHLYEPFNADFAKIEFISENYDEDPVKFWKFYFNIGKKFPKSYLIAFISNNVGFWSPSYSEHSYIEYDDYEYEMFPIEISRNSIISNEKFISFYRSLCKGEVWRTTFGVRIFFHPGFSILLLLYTICLSFKGRKNLRKQIIILSPMLAMLQILLAALASFRYAWPFLLVMPLAFTIGNDKISENS